MTPIAEIGPPSGGGPRKFEPHGRIDFSGDGDLTYWLKVFDTTHARLLEAMAQVGDDAADVAEYLRRGSDSEPAAAPQIPDGG
jgi:hypothetical protein